MNKQELKRRIIAAGGMRTVNMWWADNGHWRKVRVNSPQWRPVEAVRANGLVVGGSILHLDWSADVRYDYDGPYRFMVTWHHRNGEEYSRAEYTLNKEEQ